MAKNLGERIREARERLGMTQQQLGDAVGAARETVGNWELGTTSPRNKLGKLREVLGDDLDGAVGDRPQDDGVLMSLPPEAVEGLTPVEREELLAGVRYRALQLAREIRRRVDEDAHDR